MRKQHFLQGAAILAAAGVLSKILGAVYRIPFARMVGGEGMGIYQMAYPIYTLALALSTSGLPTALAVMISEKAAGEEHLAARKIFKVAFLVLALCGALMSAIIFKAAPFLAVRLFHNPAAFLAIRAVSPAIFLSAVVSCWRGYFQGYQNMVPTAVSQVFEQVVRVATVLLLAYYLLPLGVAYAAAGAAFGAVTGGIAAVLVLIMYSTLLDPPANKGKIDKLSSISILKQLFMLGIPVSLAGLIMPLVQGMDAAIIPGRLLASGYSATEASELYGQLTGMALTLVNLPGMLTVGLAMGLVPALSEAKALKDEGKILKTIQLALTAVFLFALPSAVGLYILAAPLCKLLYELPEVGDILKSTVPIIIAIGLYQVTSGILQGMGKMMTTLLNLTIGCTIKIILTYVLVANINIGIFGAAYATSLGFFTAGLLNIIFLVRETSLRVLDIPIVRIAAANLILTVFCHILLEFMKNSSTVLKVGVTVSAAFIAYFAIVTIFGIINVNEIKKIGGRFWRK